MGQNKWIKLQKKVFQSSSGSGRLCTYGDMHIKMLTKLKSCVDLFKEDEEQGEEKAWVTSATDTDLIRQQVRSCRAHLPWRTTESEFGLIQQLCLSTSVIPSVRFQQSANTSVFVFAYVGLQVNDSVLTLAKQQCPISALMLTSLRCSHHLIAWNTRTPRTLSTVSQRDHL